MVWTIVLTLLILWAIGFVALPVIGGLIHILLVVAVIVVLVRPIRGRPVV